MLSTWTVFLTLFILSPISYKRGFSLESTGYLFACLILFMMGSLIRTDRLSPQVDPSASRRTERVIRWVSFLGILGAGLVVIDKVVLGGMDFSQGLGQLRFELNIQFDRYKSRSPLLWIGMLLYPFGNVAVALYTLSCENYKRWTGIFVGIASFASPLVALTYAGRSLEFLLLALVFSACLVRRASGDSFLPKRRMFHAMMLAHLLLTVIGTYYIFSSRSAALADYSSGMTMYRWIANLDATVNPTLAAEVEDPSLTGEISANTIMMAGYMTHSLAELDYLIREDTDSGPYWGLYQIWPLEKLMDAFGVSDREGISIQDDQDHSGLFYTAWGCMYLDFGVWLSLPIVGFIGIVSSFAYQRGVLQGSLSGKMALSLIFMCIMITPIHSPIHMGNTLQVLGCMFVTRLLLRLRGKASSMIALPQPGVSGGYSG
jgi:hypothetical protein